MSGFYAGVMITADGPKVLEYNCRLGDPERSHCCYCLRSDLVELCKAALDGRLHEMTVDWDPRAAPGVVMTAAGYPGPYHRGRRDRGLAASRRGTGRRWQLFHAGTLETKEGSCRYPAAGCCAPPRSAARSPSAEIWPTTWSRGCVGIGAYYRTDIGYRAIAQEQGE